MSFQATCLGLTIELIIFGLTGGAPPVWFFPLGVASFSISAFLNLVVSGLLVLRLVLTHYELKREGSLGYSHNLLPLITILVESGIFTFVSQVIWTVLFGLQNPGFNSINGAITMIYVSTSFLCLLGSNKLTCLFSERASPPLLFSFGWPWELH